MSKSCSCAGDCSWVNILADGAWGIYETEQIYVSIWRTDKDNWQSKSISHKGDNRRDLSNKMLAQELLFCTFFFHPLNHGEIQSPAFVILGHLARACQVWKVAVAHDMCSPRWCELDPTYMLRQIDWLWRWLSLWLSLRSPVLINLKLTLFWDLKASFKLLWL